MIIVITSVDLVYEPVSGNNVSKDPTQPIWYELRRCQPCTITSVVGTCVGWFFNPVLVLCWFFDWLYGLGSWTQYQPGMKRIEKPGTRTWLVCSKVHNPKPKTNSGHHQCWSTFANFKLLDFYPVGGQEYIRILRFFYFHNWYYSL